MAKMTKAQKRVLTFILAANDKGRSVDKGQIRTATPTLEYLRQEGLIESEAPFAYAFHSVRITPAGRAALSDKD